MVITTNIVPLPGYPHLKCIDKRGEYAPDDAGFAACIRYLADPSTPDCLIMVDQACVLAWSITTIPYVTKNHAANKNLWWTAHNLVVSITPDGLIGVLAHPNG